MMRALDKQLPSLHAKLVAQLIRAIVPLGRAAACARLQPRLVQALAAHEHAPLSVAELLAKEAERQETTLELIASENPAKPLSDDQLVNQLKEKNVMIARRTVAKYRAELNVLPSHLRRTYQ